MSELKCSSTGANGRQANASMDLPISTPRNGNRAFRCFYALRRKRKGSVPGGASSSRGQHDVVIEIDGETCTSRQHNIAVGETEEAIHRNVDQERVEPETPEDIDERTPSPHRTHLPDDVDPHAHATPSRRRPSSYADPSPSPPISAESLCFPYRHPPSSSPCQTDAVAPRRTPQHPLPSP
ncbi:hypothetical protein MRB53_022191 [Persea americana]|uniref:Uncharacterized protein n=1 Tax=Persea americana TaxID=3435 RepID=A0ACC2L6G2_PERAE|nr:hypothetical protein MRB53_022191 [Persea americana]